MARRTSGRGCHQWGLLVAALRESRVRLGSFLALPHPLSHLEFLWFHETEGGWQRSELQLPEASSFTNKYCLLCSLPKPKPKADPALVQAICSQRKALI